MAVREPAHALGLALAYELYTQGLPALRGTCECPHLELWQLGLRRENWPIELVMWWLSCPFRPRLLTPACFTPALTPEPCHALLPRSACVGRVGGLHVCP